MLGAREPRRGGEEGAFLCLLSCRITRKSVARRGEFPAGQGLNAAHTPSQTNPPVTTKPHPETKTPHPTRTPTNDRPANNRTATTPANPAIDKPNAPRST